MGFLDILKRDNIVVIFWLTSFNVLIDPFLFAFDSQSLRIRSTS